MTGDPAGRQEVACETCGAKYYGRTAKSASNALARHKSQAHYMLAPPKRGDRFRRYRAETRARQVSTGVPEAQRDEKESSRFFDAHGAVEKLVGRRQGHCGAESAS